MQNEKRLIDANALKDRFKLRIDWLEKDKHDEYTTGIWDGCLYDDKLIDEAPTVDAVEVVHGRWIKGENWSVTCSVCGCLSIAHDGKNFCPNCGAKMDGGGACG